MPLPAMPASHMGTISSRSCPSQPPAHVPRKEVEDTSGPRDPAAHVADLEEVPDSWLQPSLALTITATWKVSQQMDLLYSSLFVNSTFQIKKLFFFLMTGKTLDMNELIQRELIWKGFHPGGNSRNK